MTFSSPSHTSGKGIQWIADLMMVNYKGGMKNPIKSLREQLTTDNCQVVALSFVTGCRSHCCAKGEDIANGLGGGRAGVGLVEAAGP